ncbi:MAG: CYTH and CHAD domain-containing protein [Burkholderiaceae bacterium]|nr:CYTH and CHAD domain-containing protein [Burkholderiaceae bacterium]
MEVEFKFHIDKSQLAALQTAAQRGDTTTVRLQAHYFDTKDAALSSRGIALRLRKEGEQWVQTVKARGDGPLDREEHNVEVDASTPSVQPELHAGTKAGKRLREALDSAEGPLEETYRTEIDRSIRNLQFDGGVVEMALDTGKIVANGGTEHEKTASVCELELELKEGPVSGLVEMATQWASKYGLVVNTVSKAERGERLLAAEWGRQAVKARPMVAPSSTRKFLKGPTLQRAAVTNCLEQILGNASEIVEGSDGEAHVHQLRVGIRRLRTVLRELDTLTPGNFNPAWEPSLVEVFRRLGELRDRDQAVQTIGAELLEAGAPSVDAPPRATTASPLEIVRSPSFQTTLIALMGFTAHAADSKASEMAPHLGARDTRNFLHHRLRTLRKKVLKDAVKFEALSVDDQHSVRKRLKRLRFLTEFAAPAIKREGSDFLESLQPALSALGRLNDEHMANTLYREMGDKDPKAWFGVGWLAARRKASVKATKKALVKMQHAPRMRRV